MVKSAGDALAACGITGDRQNTENSARYVILMHDSYQRKEQNVQSILGHRWWPDALQLTSCPGSD